MAHDIMAEFISYSGKSVVSLDQAPRRRIEEIINSGLPVRPDVFDSAAVHVLKLIENESWPKFLAKLIELQVHLLLWWWWCWLLLSDGD